MGADEGIEDSVADTRIGLASEDLERIFHPFEQVEQSASRKFSGTGLGLSLRRQLHPIPAASRGGTGDRLGEMEGGSLPGAHADHALGTFEFDIRVLIVYTYDVFSVHFGRRASDEIHLHQGSAQ